MAAQEERHAEALKRMEKQAETLIRSLNVKDMTVNGMNTVNLRCKSLQQKYWNSK